MVDVRQHQTLSRVRRAFTLMEALIASAILFAGVLAVISAITSGQRKAIEAERQITATLAAEDLMGQIIQVPYHELDGVPLVQSAGEMMAMISITESDEDLPGLDVRVHGQTVQVQVLLTLSDTRPLAELSHFIPEPQP